MCSWLQEQKIEKKKKKKKEKTCIYIFKKKNIELKVKVQLLRRVQLFAKPMDCSLPGFSVHGIFQARVLEWVAIAFFRGSSRSKDQTQVSCIAGKCFTL